MNLLAATLYDPAVAVNKATTALIAMTALDTTNLRLRFTVPPSGRCLVRLAGVLHGATTFPTILLGVMDGATIKGRIAPMQTLGNTAVATAQVKVFAEFVVTGLTPGTDTNWDAAYGVEVTIASTGLKYGGPNNTTTNDAFGGFLFEIWDPSPAYTPAANNVPPTTTVHQKIDTIDDFLDTEVAAIKAKTDSLTFTTANKVDATIQAADDLAQAAADKVWSTAARVLTAGTNIALAKGTGVTGFNDLSAADVRTATGLASANLDTQLAAIDTETDKIASIKAKTDSLTFTAANKVDATIQAAGDFAQGAADKVWDTAARVLTAGTNIVLAKGTGITGFTDLDAAGIRGAVGLAAADLDTQLDALANLDAAVSSRMATYTQPTGFLAASFPSDPADQSLIIAATDAILNRIGVDGAGLTAIGDARLANLDATVSSRMATFAYTAPDNANIALIKAKTDLIPAAPAAVGDIPTALQNADALLKRDMSAVTGESARSPLNAIRFLRNKYTITGATLSVKKEDDATEAWSATLATDAAALPVVGSDPA